MVAWIINDMDLGWVNVEKNSLPGIPLSVLVFLSKQSQRKRDCKNVWMKHTLKVWSTVQKRMRGIAVLSKAMQIGGNLDPPLTDITFKRWAGRDLKVFDQFFLIYIYIMFCSLGWRPVQGVKRVPGTDLPFTPCQFLFDLTPEDICTTGQKVHLTYSFDDC